jgi:uncharacterized RDD family membrane protein YckC
MDTLHEEARGPEVGVRPKVDLGKRFLALLIDGILAGVAGAILSIVHPVLGALASAGYMVLRDGLTFPVMDQRSIGKRLIGLRPVRLDGGPMDPETSLRRNWMFGIGGLAQLTWLFGLAWILSLAGTILFFYEVYKVFTDPAGRRWGDEMAGTQVVESAL